LGHWGSKLNGLIKFFIKFESYIKVRLALKVIISRTKKNTYLMMLMITKSSNAEIPHFTNHDFRFPAISYSVSAFLDYS